LPDPFEELFPGLLAHALPISKTNKAFFAVFGCSDDDQDPLLGLFQSNAEYRRRPLRSKLKKPSEKCPLAQSHRQVRESNSQNISVYSCGCLFGPALILNHVSIFEMASSRSGVMGES